MNGERDDPRPERSGPDSTVALVRRAKTGDDEARNRLFGRLVPIVKRWATGRLPAWARYRSDSDDLVQDALLATMRNLEGIDADGSAKFYAYLYTTLQSRIFDEIERAKLRPRASGEPVEEASLSPLDRLLNEEALDRYRRGLARLGEDDRTAIVLRVELGMSLSETAAELGKPSADAARMAVARAIKRLVEAMQDER
jgi:RNA polymerase sigma-70 factor, ECF subfamily